MIIFPKVVTFSAIKNFDYASWRDFSDLRLIDPSPVYPIIEINVSCRYNTLIIVDMGQVIMDLNLRSC